MFCFFFGLLTRQFPELQSQWALDSGSALKLWRWSLPLPRCRTGCPLCFCSCCNVWQYMTHPLVFQNPAPGKHRRERQGALVMMRMTYVFTYVTRNRQNQEKLDLANLRNRIIFGIKIKLSMQKNLSSVTIDTNVFTVLTKDILLRVFTQQSGFN